MTLQDIEQLLTARRLEIYKEALEEAGSKAATDKEKFDTFLILYDDYKRRADKCLKVLTENNFSELDDFAAKRIIDAFAFASTLHLEADILLLKEARKFAYTEKLSKAVEVEIEKEQKRLDGLRATFNEALQGFREDYTALLGNEQVILDATLRSELGEYMQ